MIFYFHHKPFVYLSLAVAYLLTEWHNPPLIPFPSINNISTSVNNFNFTSVVFKVTSQANPEGEKKFSGSSS